MRRTLAAALAVTAIFVTLVVSAQPAAADDPGATEWRHYGQNTELVVCQTPYRTGVLGQYGAWGYYVDGCTARAYCPTWATICRVTGEAWIGTYSSLGHSVTLNSRLRRFNSSGAVLGWQDTSCSGVNYCRPNPPLTTYLWPGQSASEQCNGVRANAPNTASVRCHVYVEHLY